MKKVKLGEICEIVTGSTPKSSNPNYWNGEYKWITPAEISDDDFIVFDTQRKITKLGIEETGLKSFPTGTVLLSSRAPIGKVAISGCEMYCNQGFKNFICSNKINNEYLYYFFKSRKNYLNILGRGATFKEISKSIVSDIEIFLPTYGIQRKQVKVLKKIDKLIYTRKEQLIEFEYLVKSRFNEMFILSDFSLKRLGELVDEVRYGTSLPATINGKYGYLRMNNITENGKLNIQNLKHIDIPEKDLEKYVVRKGDVLFNRTNSIELVGKTCIYELDFDMVIAGYIIRIRTNNNILNPRYLSEFLNFPSTKKFLRNIAKGAVNQANINAKELQDISIPLAPLSLQNEFADFVAQVDKSQFACQIVIKLWRNSLKSSII
ncbi:MAG: restriction endonuclease subunit S [Streptococcus mitis]|uniref:restriction endonuclease subunit S n=1 Tax=uncultured Streptococcus sp. TaxID=83427 RepID=UPI00280A6A30|nr:restriction endonuclease subunit S [uncultured Streptococcus sp.]MDU1404687.1 restriction endonuclease subunit S [Streptococcus mitis]